MFLLGGGYILTLYGPADSIAFVYFRAIVQANQVYLLYIIWILTINNSKPKASFQNPIDVYIRYTDVNNCFMLAWSKNQSSKIFGLILL